MQAKRSGFTLIEILIVIGILALLMGMATQMMGGVTGAQGRAKARADMEIIATALENFSNQYGGYPRLNSALNEKEEAAKLYKCLVGKMGIKAADGQVQMVDLKKPTKPFVDATKFSIADPEKGVSADVDPEKNGVFIADPWGEPYLYFYNNSTLIGNSSDVAWRSPGFILLTKGPDLKAGDVSGMYSTGISPTTDQYYLNDLNVDNIVQGKEE